MSTTLLAPITSVPYTPASSLGNTTTVSNSLPLSSNATSNVDTGASASTTNQDFSLTAARDAFVDYSATGSYFCQTCNEYTEVVDDHKSGDLICSGCGTIAQERLVQQDAEYRLFSEDSASYSKIRVGAAYNPLMEYSLTEKSRLERDEKEFLWEGLRNIEDVLYKLYNGDTTNKRVSERAKELFQKAFHFQVQQKKGAIEMKRSGGKNLANKNRQKFSRRKQFVITALIEALKEAGISRWKIEDLSEQMEGIQVSQYSVENCLKDLDPNAKADGVL